MALVPNVCMHVCMYVCHFMSCYVTLELQNQVGTGRSYVCTARQLIVPYNITDTTIKHVFLIITIVAALRTNTFITDILQIKYFNKTLIDYT